MVVPGLDSKTTSTEAERKEHDPLGGVCIVTRIPAQGFPG